MTVEDLLDVLKEYRKDEKIEIDIYDGKTGKYFCTDRNPIVDKDGLDFVIKVKAEANEISTKI